MDNLPKMQYENPDMLFKYKDTVGVSSLEMVDNIVDMQLCRKDSLKSNAAINTFIENKKLTMGKDKCHKIHCGKRNNFCPELKVHKETMHESM